MATEPTDSAGGATEEANWLTQDTLHDQQESDVTVLPDSGAKVKYRKILPEKFASLVDTYQIAELAEEPGKIDPDADLSETDGVDLDAAEPEDLDDLDEKFRIILFYRDVIVPQIARPEQVHWADPDHMQESGWVDISELPNNDKLHLVACITGQDPKQLMDQAHDRIDRFQG